MSKVIFADHYGFCFGVSRAVKIAGETALKLGKKEAFVWKEIVHNQHVINRLKKLGVGAVKNINQIKKGKTVIWSSHGVTPIMWSKAKEKGLKIVDTTCPMVAQVHRLAKEASDRGRTVVYLGDKGHDEQQGVKGEVSTAFITIRKVADLNKLKIKDPAKLTVLTQTTLAVDETSDVMSALKAKYPQAEIHDNICRSTTERQEAVKKLARQTPLIIVVGSSTSANSRRLKEVAEKTGTKAILVNDVDDLDLNLIKPHRLVGITAGASTPPEIIDKIVNKIESL